MSSRSSGRLDRQGVSRRLASMRAAFADSKGAGVVSMLLLIPAIVLLVELAVLGGRLAGARGEVQSAARQAAREASLAAGPASAPSLASAVAASSLGNAGFRCNSPTVAVGGSTNFVAGGRVEVSVTCVVPLADLSSLPAPGQVTISRSAVEPIDPYRVVDP